MSEKQIFALVIIAAVYLYWQAKGVTAYSQTGPGGGVPGTLPARTPKIFRPNTIVSTASTMPRDRRSIPGRSNPWRSGGYQVLPQLRTGAIISPVARAPGAAQPSGGIRSRSTSTGVAISPRWPQQQVNSTGLVRTGNGNVQVPAWAAAPSMQFGPGGQGTIVHLGD